MTPDWIMSSNLSANADGAAATSAAVTAIRVSRFLSDMRGSPSENSERGVAWAGNSYLLAKCLGAFVGPLERAAFSTAKSAQCAAGWCCRWRRTAYQRQSRQYRQTGQTLREARSGRRCLPYRARVSLRGYAPSAHPTRAPAAAPCGWRA